MNAMNNFTISGFVVNDAKVKNFEKASVARFGLSFRTTEKKGAWVYVYPRYGGNKKMQTDTICSKRDRGCVRNLANFYTKDGKNI